MNPDPAAPGPSIAVASRWRSPGQTLVEVLKYRAHLHHDKLLFGFLDSELRITQSLTYGSLLSRATRFAGLLSSSGLAGQRALLAYPQGPDFVVAFFAANIAGVIPVPVKIPRREEEFARFARMGVDAEATAILVPAKQQSIFERIVAQGQLAELRTLSEPVDGEQVADLPSSLQVSADDVALLQYTSGSTSSPKGIQVTHANMVANLECIRTGFEHDSATISLSWLPMFHDMGLIGHVLEPLYVGFPAYFLNPTLVIQEPGRWLRAISRFRVTATGGPNFGYELCLKRPPREEAGALDLSTWKVAYTASETIRASTIEEFSKQFAAVGFSPRAFYPCYGLAEATLIVTGGQADDEVLTVSVDGEQLARGLVVPSEDVATARRLVSCGPPRPGVQVVIVDPQAELPSATGHVGEIWVAGPTVAAGYRGNPEETRRVFGARLPGWPGTAFLRTGDLGFLDGNELFVVGRLHDMIIIRGRNLYPEDIEATVTAACAEWNPTGCAVFADGDPTAEATAEIVVALEFFLSAGQLDRDKVASRARAQVANAYGVTVRDVVFAARLPRTSSGKIRRSECARRYQLDVLDPARVVNAPASAVPRK
ncbi:MAG: fatty acyl-AMP ligase [Trebonia sp.]